MEKSKEWWAEFYKMKNNSDMSSSEIRLALDAKLSSKKSCWGCDHDYLAFCSEDDLTEMIIYGEKEDICPDCYEDISEDALIDDARLMAGDKEGGK